MERTMKCVICGKDVEVSEFAAHVKGHVPPETKARMESEKQMVRENLVEWPEYAVPETLAEFIVKVREACEGVPDEDVRLDFCPCGDYGWDVAFGAYRMRKETDEEQHARRYRETREARALEASERDRYEELKAKFEGGEDDG